MKITLCGSARFEDEFKTWNKTLSLAGHVVYGLSTYPSDNDGNKGWYSEEQKAVLDQVHKRKIDNSDAILVIDIDAYIGDSTKSEIAHAVLMGKKVYSLWPRNGPMVVDCMSPYSEQVKVTRIEVEPINVYDSRCDLLRLQEAA